MFPSYDSTCVSDVLQAKLDKGTVDDVMIIILSFRDQAMIL